MFYVKMVAAGKVYDEVKKLRTEITDMKKNNRLVNILAVSGGIIFVIAAIGFFFKFLTFFQMLIIAEIGLIFLIPYNIIFAKEILSEKNNSNLYWISKILILPLCIILGIVMIVHELLLK